MNKKIENVFDYLDYRLLLNDDFLERSNCNHSYSLRAYSRDLDVSPGFLSDVLRGNKALSPIKGRDVFAKIGLADHELLYAEKLVVVKNADNEVQKNEAEIFIQRHYNKNKFISDSKRDLYIKSLEHFIIYGIVRKTEKFEDVVSIAKQLGITKDQVDEILAEYKSEGYVVDSEGRLSALDEKILIRDHQRLVPMTIQFSNLIGNLIQSLGGMRVDDRTVHGLIVGLDQPSLDLAVEAHKHFIQTLHRLSQKNEKVEHFLFFSDMFLALPMKLGQKLN